MEGSEHIEDFKAKLNDLISSFKQFYGSLKTLKGDNVNKTLIKQGDDHWENLHSRMEKMKVAYDTFSNQTAENVDKYVKEINSIEEEDRKDNSVLKNALLEMKTSKVNNSVIQIYEECIAKREERLNRMKNTNEEFSNNINEITEDFANKLESAKNAAMKRLIRHSAEKGGNAVIGLDFDYITFSSNIIGVVANGTSVVIEKVD